VASGFRPSGQRGILSAIHSRPIIGRKFGDRLKESLKLQDRVVSERAFIPSSFFLLVSLSLSLSLSLSHSFSLIRNSGMLGYRVPPSRVIVFRVVLIVLAGLMGGLTWFGRDCRRASSSLVAVGRISQQR